MIRGQWPAGFVCVCAGAHEQPTTSKQLAHRWATHQKGFLVGQFRRSFEPVHVVTKDQVSWA